MKKPEPSAAVCDPVFGRPPKPNGRKPPKRRPKASSSVAPAVLAGPLTRTCTAMTAGLTLSTRSANPTAGVCIGLANASIGCAPAAHADGAQAGAPASIVTPRIAAQPSKATRRAASSLLLELEL